MSALSKAKRDSITILVDILRAISFPNSTKKMTIVYKANLNFERVNRYLELLIATGHVELINYRKDNNSYRITRKGREFVADYDRLMDSLRLPISHRGSNSPIVNAIISPT